MEAEELKQLIQEKTGISRAELEVLLEKKLKEYASLLTEVGALYLIAKDLGLDIEMERVMNPRIEIGELKPGMDGITVRGRVSRIFPMREYEREGRKGKYASFLLEDESGSIRVVLWNRDAELVSKGVIKPGSVVEVINGRVEEYNGRLSLVTGITSRILVENPEYTKVSDMKEGMKGVFSRLRVYTTLGTGKTSEGKPYTSFIGEDDSGRIRVVVWGKEMDLSVGDEVVVEGGYVEEGERGPTLYVGEEGNILVEKKEYLFKPVEDVRGGERVEVIGVVVRIVNKKFFVAKCLDCGGEASYEEGEWVCNNCGSKHVDVVPVLSFVLSDGSGNIKVFGVGNPLKGLFSTPEEADTFKEKLLGSIVSVRGTVRGESDKEILLHSIDAPNKEDYIKMLINSLGE